MTIVEIAKEAGVSVATVSRVLNGGPVSAEKRSRVEAVIAKYKFSPNALARGLISRQSQTIGLIVHGINNHFHMEFIQVVERFCTKAGYLLFVCICEGENQAEMEQRFLSDLLTRQVNGIILHEVTPENFKSGLVEYVASRIAVVMVHTFDAEGKFNSVEVDQVVGMKKVMRHLIDLGHRDIFFVRGRYGHSYDSKEAVWRESLSSIGAAPSPEALVVIEEGNAEEGILEAEEKLDRIFKGGRVPSAVFACNDIMATGALNAAHRNGIAMPERLSLIGHDNTMLSSIGHFASVDLKTASVGHASVDLLEYAMKNKDAEPRRLILTPDLVLRSSTGPARRDPSARSK